MKPDRSPVGFSDRADHVRSTVGVRGQTARVTWDRRSETESADAREARLAARECVWAYGDMPSGVQPAKFVSDYRLNERHYGALQGFVKADVEAGLHGHDPKAVAGWRGFKWGQSGADGARALLWWRQWRGEGVNARGSSHALRWILTYNRDDGLATWAVAQWLLSGDQGLV